MIGKDKQFSSVMFHLVYRINGQRQ